MIEMTPQVKKYADQVYETKLIQQHELDDNVDNDIIQAEITLFCRKCQRQTIKPNPFHHRYIQQLRANEDVNLSIDYLCTAFEKIKLN